VWLSASKSDESPHTPLIKELQAHSSSTRFPWSMALLVPGCMSVRPGFHLSHGWGQGFDSPLVHFSDIASTKRFVPFDW
jgi:hypothetical protein